MTLTRSALALLFACAGAVAAIPADEAEDHAGILAAFRAAKSKQERLAILKGKGDEQVERFVAKLLDEERRLRLRNEFAELDSFQQWAEEATGLIGDPDLRERYELACLYDRGRNELVRDCLSEAAETFKKLLAACRKPKYKALRPHALQFLAQVQAQQGDYLGGLKTIEEARAELPGPEDSRRAPAEAALLGILGRLYVEIGDYTKAEKALGESLRLAAKGTDPTTVLVDRMHTALIAIRRGRYAEAIEAYERLLEESRTSGLTLAESDILNNLGLALLECNRMSEALKRFEEARKLSAGLRQPRREALALYNLAFAHGRLGAEQDALRYLLAAGKLFSAVGDKAGAARCLKLSGMMHLEAGNAPEAEKAFAECLSLVKATGSKSQAAELSFLLGVQLEEVGNRSKAAEAYATAAAAYAELGDPVREALARLKTVWTSRPDGKDRLDPAGIAAFKGRVDRLNDARLTSLYYEILADCRVHRGEWGAAIDELRVAIGATEGYLAEVDDPLLKASAGSGDFTLYHQLAAALLGKGDPAGAFAAAERGKARALARLLGRSRVRISKGMTPAERKEESGLREAVASAACKFSSGMRFANGTPGKAESLQEGLKEAEANYEAFRRRLYTDHPELRGLRGELPGIDLAELQKAVFAREPNLAVVSYSVGWDRVLIAVVTAGEKPGGPARVAVRSVAVGERELAQAAEKFWRLCQNAKAGRPVSDKLYGWLIEPVAKDLAGKKHLLVVPCHPLLGLPFQALAADLESPYLIEQYAVSYAPSVAALLEMRRRGNGVRGPGRADRLPVLAVGGVTFAGDLTELPASGPEAEAVGKVFGERSRVLVGEKATRPEVAKAMPAARFIHFATHGLVNSPRPLFSALAVAPADAKDDGRLYAHDVMDLDLTAEMVVLSACETGRGRDYRGEGTVGLAWSFFAAGTPTAVVSQWPVSDQATAELMRVFYGRLRAGEDASKAESLRQAALALLKGDGAKHPRYWAPFVMIGDWRK